MIMWQNIVFLSILAGFAVTENIKSIEQPEHTAWGYIEKYGIPRAREIRKAEENNSRIIGGFPADIGQYPFQAGLVGDIIGLDERSVCGGSLLTTTRVVTAAHCWYDGVHQAWRLTVILGTTTLFSGGTRVESSVVATHPSWTPLLVRNDVAVIYLPNAVILSDVIAPITLPTGALLDEDFAGESAIAIGFGVTSNDGSISQDQTLSHVKVNVISNNICSFAFPFIIQPSHLCTHGVGDVSSCRGDSGGPLLIAKNGTHIMIGIASFVSSLGCEANLPAAFSRVTSFVDFITSHV